MEKNALFTFNSFVLIDKC